MLPANVAVVLVFTLLLAFGLHLAGRLGFPLPGNLRYQRRISHKKKLRATLFGVYGITSFAIILFFYWDDKSCLRPGSQNYIVMAAKLALAIALWDFVASIIGALSLPTARGLWGSTLIVGLGFCYLPFILNPAEFQFRGSWLDLTCFFTETNGWVLFPFILTPIFMLMTFLRELYISHSG